MIFPGQYYDAENGLHHNWNRFYDPSTGRYITADPIGLAGGMNLYAYVQNDPVNWTDLEGLTKKGINYDSNWRGRPRSWTPNDTGPRAPNPLPKNYSPNGINNLPGKEIPVSPNASRGARLISSLLDALGAPGGMARLPLLILPPGISACAANPNMCMAPDFDPNCQNNNET